MSQIPTDPPRYVIWEITRACNLRCHHCAVSAGRRRADELSTEEALEVCDELADLGVPAVSLMGGELLLRKDWETITARLRERGVEVGIITNGWKFDDDVERCVERLGVCQVGTSLDAARAEVHDRLRGRKGAHARALDTIQRIVEMPLAYRTVITSVSKSNISELPAMRDWLERNARGVTWMINIATCHDEARFESGSQLDADDVVELAKFIHRARAEPRDVVEVTATHDLGYFSRTLTDLYNFDWHGCVAGLETMGIRSNGDVTGCLVLDDSYIEANVRTRTLASLWGDPDAFAYNRCFTPDMLEGACRGCEHGEICRGGCRNMASSVTGSRFDYPYCLRRMELEGRTL